MGQKKHQDPALLQLLVVSEALSPLPVNPRKTSTGMRRRGKGKESFCHLNLEDGFLSPGSYNVYLALLKGSIKFTPSFRYMTAAVEALRCPVHSAGASAEQSSEKL